MSSRSASAAKVARHARPHATGSAAEQTATRGNRRNARCLSPASRAQAFGRMLRHSDGRGVAGAGWLRVQALCRADRGGQPILPVQTERRHRHRRHDHRKRAAACGQPRRIRTRHVAELDWPLDPLEQKQPTWNAHQERADGTHCRTRTANFGRGVEHHQAPGARAKAGGAAEIRRHAHRRLRRAPLRERELRRNPSVHGERRSATAHDRRPRQGRRAIVPSQAGFTQDMGGRVTRYPMRAVGEDRIRPDARHPARRALDGCHGRRLFLPVPDRDAQYRSASAEGDGESSCAGPTIAGLRRRRCRKRAAACTPCCACRSPIRTQSLRHVEDLRPPQGRRRLHGDDGAQSSGQRQRLYEGLSRYGGARADARVPFRPELARAGVPRLQPVHLGPRARLLLLQHPSLHQLGHQRASASAFPSCR